MRAIFKLLYQTENDYICHMKFCDKYPKLKEKQFLSQLLMDTVFATMSLENQQVSKPQLTQIIEKLLAEKELKSGQFFFN